MANRSKGRGAKPRVYMLLFAALTKAEAVAHYVYNCTSSKERLIKAYDGRAA